MCQKSQKAPALGELQPICKPSKPVDGFLPDNQLWESFPYLICLFHFIHFLFAHLVRLLHMALAIP